MKLDHWLRFTWDLTRLAGIEAALPEHYEISRVTADDEKEARRVISSSFVLDAAWNGAIHEITEAVESWLDGAFEAGEKLVFALRHGTRIIGATAVSLSPDAETNLAPGPCVLIEYRNRGFGTHLLLHSLATLHDAGLPQATAIAKESSPAAKFLYTKFHSTVAPRDETPVLAA
jgi:hypothetical protein